MVIAGAGTGGTVTGIARGLKKDYQDVLFVDVDPVGSILGQPTALNEKKSGYKVEGIEYGFCA